MPAHQYRMDEERVTFSARSPDFQRAYVAMSYFWGARGEALSEAFSSLALHGTTASLLSGLTHQEREQRAAALSVELAKLSAALDQRSLVR